MEKKIEKAFDFAAEYSKQILTLSTAIITLSIAFVKDILGGNSEYSNLLIWCWVLLIISIIFGVGNLMTLAGNLETRGKEIEKKVKGEEVSEKVILPLSIYSSNTLFFSNIQVFSFLFAIVLLTRFGCKSLPNENISQSKCDDCIEKIYEKLPIIRQIDTVLVETNLEPLLNEKLTEFSNELIKAREEEFKVIQAENKKLKEKLETIEEELKKHTINKASCGTACQALKPNK